MSKENLPKVFLIGEHDKAYAEMLETKPELLLNVCEGKMDSAFQVWGNLLVEMEQKALEQNFEINGIKVWINIFWGPDGRIKHISYYPKPNSKNLDYHEFSTFLYEFVATYQPQLTYSKSFAHYGSTSFPTFLYTEKE